MQIEDYKTEEEKLIHPDRTADQPTDQIQVIS